MAMIDMNIKDAPEVFKNFRDTQEHPQMEAARNGLKPYMTVMGQIYGQYSTQVMMVAMVEAFSLWLEDAEQTKNFSAEQIGELIIMLRDNLHDMAGAQEAGDAKD